MLKIMPQLQLTDVTSEWMPTLINRVQRKLLVMARAVSERLRFDFRKALGPRRLVLSGKLPLARSVLDDFDDARQIPLGAALKDAMLEDLPHRLAQPHRHAEIANAHLELR